MIKLIQSTFYKEDEVKKRLIEFIRSAKQLSFGPECERFEKNFTSWQGRLDSVVYNSGSSANLALIQALLNLGRLKKGDAVAFSALTWATNVMPLIMLGLVPVPIDVELDTLNVSSATLKDVLRQHDIKALFMTHVLGLSGDVGEIKEICDDRGILLLEDTCESLGSVYQGKKLGNFGLASTFSFFVGHHLSTIEGGAVATDDPELARMLRIVRAHGWDRNLSPEDQKDIRKKSLVESDFYALFTFYDLGFNLRPTEIAGFIGNEQLKFIDEVIERRRKSFLRMAEAVYARVDLYHPIAYSHLDLPSVFAFPVVVREESFRNKLMEVLKGNVEIRPLVAGDITQHPFYRKYVSENRIHKNADLVHRQGFYLGNYPELTQGEIDSIITLLTSAI